MISSCDPILWAYPDNCLIHLADSELLGFVLRAIGVLDNSFVNLHVPRPLNPAEGWQSGNAADC